MLVELLSRKKKAILKRWSDLILDTYPPDTSRFLKAEKDRFHNPVGHSVIGETEALYDELLGEMNPDRIRISLDKIIRIRAVQDFSPSKAVAFVLLLKEALREELKSEITGGRVPEDLLELESRIDRVVLSAFDLYMECREKIFEIKTREAGVNDSRLNMKKSSE